MTNNILFESKHLTVAANDCPTETVFVTFNEMGMVANGASFWADDFFSRIGVAAVGFVSKSPNWYPLADMNAAIKAIKPILGNRRIVTYGFSQGAYGALKFSKVLNAFAALAFSPTFSIDPQVVGDFDRRYVSYFRPELMNGKAIDCNDLCAKSYVFFDPLVDVEKINALKVGTLSGLQPAQVEMIPMYFTDHGSVRVISESRLGRKLVNFFQMPNSSPRKEVLRSLIRSGRASSRTYQIERVNQLLNRRSNSTLFLSRVKDRVEAERRSLIDLRIALKRNSLTEAEILLDHVSDDAFADQPIRLWHLFRSVSFSKGETRLALALKSIAPNDVFTRLHGVNSFLAQGDRTRAAAELQEIIKLNGMEGCLNHVLEIVRQIQDLQGKLILEELLMTDQSRLRFDEAQRLQIQIAILEISASLEDDRAIMKGAAALSGEAKQNHSLRERLIQLLSKIEDQERCFEFASNILGLSVEEATLFRLHQIDHLIGRNAFRATRQLRDIKILFNKKAVLWHMYAQCNERIGNVSESIAAEKKAIRFATASNREEWRLYLARFYMAYGRRLRALLQLYLAYRNSSSNLSVLKTGRETAHRLGLMKMEYLFARQIMRNCTHDIGPMVELCLLDCVLGKFKRASALVDQVQRKIADGHELSEGSWPKLVQVLRFVKRPMEANAVLDSGLRRFPSHAELRQMREADMKLAEFTSIKGVASVPTY